MSGETYQYKDTSFFPLDGKGFGNENPGNNHNYSFTMALHSTFTKTNNTSAAQTFEFEGDDDVWAFVNNKLELDLGGVHARERKSFTVDTSLRTNVSYNFDFFFAERHTTQSDLIITTNLFTYPEVKININAADVTVKCGDTATIPGDVFQISGIDTVHRKDYGKSVSWKFIESGGNADSTLKGNYINPPTVKGDTAFFSPTEAYLADSTPARAIIEASVVDSVTGAIARDTVIIKILPGDPDHLVIEENADPKNWLNDDPLGQLYFNQNQTQANAYAIARDKFGNYVRRADSLKTVWTKTLSSVTVDGESGKKYHGIVIRAVDNGKDTVIATEPGLRPDSVPVELTKACIDSLRLVDANNHVIDTIKMTTDDTGTFYVQGLKSTETQWSTVTAKWELSTNLKSVTPPPNENSLWTYSPTNAGIGKLKLSRPFDTSATSCLKKPIKEVPVIVTLVPPSVNIKLLTPDSLRIAGKPIKAEIEIKNSDGRIPGHYCFGENGNESQKVVYQDKLINPVGGKRPNPQITVDNNKSDLNTGSKDTYKHDQCFNDGLDTIEVILYYAPKSTKDSMHVLTVNIGSNRKAQTDPFTISPGEVDSITITNQTFNDINGPENFNSGDSIGRRYYSTGYDRYGNFIGFIVSNWKTSGEIKDVHAEKTNRFDFAPGTVVYDQEGYIHTTYIGINNKVITDSLRVLVSAGWAVLESAITRDMNGNGYLDQIELKFNKKVTISDDQAIRSKFSIINGLTHFSVEKISPNGNDSTTYILKLIENQTEEPQTDWTPYLSYTIDNINSVTNKIMLDGAAPVVWRAIMEVKDVKDPTKNILTIELSESVKNYKTQSAFSILIQPDSLFTVWKKDTQFTPVPLLDGIISFQSTDKKTFTVRMTNKKDITNENFINIKDVNRFVIDERGNFPSDNNIKRRVELKTISGPPIVIPNPTRPSFIHTAPGIIVLQHDREARQFARDGQGAVINIVLAAPVDSSEYVKGYLKIYDLAGNIVANTYDNNVLREAIKASEKPLSTYNVDFYWNGSNGKGMKVAPGVYKAVLYFTYSKHSQPNQRHSVNIGIKK